VFTKREDLQRLYEPLIHTAVNAIKSDDVARFLGRKQVQGNFNGELGTNFGTRIETRLKHHIVASTPSANFATATFGVTSACRGLRSPVCSNGSDSMVCSKVPRRHEYYLTALGRPVIACCLRMRQEALPPTLVLQA
jgi:hypothetical protein